MIRHKMLAVAAASAAIVLAAGPAHALRYLAEPNNGGGVPGCSSTRKVIQTWKIDNPRKSGYQQWGSVRVYQARCFSSVSDAGFTGVWTEARLDFAGDALKTGITVDSGSPYRLTDWDAKGAGNWHDSPALQRPSGAFVLPDVATSADGDLDLYNA